MSRKTRLVLATLSFLAVLFSPMLVLQVLYWLRIYFAPPTWLLSLASGLALLMAFEVANRIGPDPSETPLFKLRKHYPTRRDKLVLLSAITVGVIIASYRPAGMVEFNWPMMLLIWAISCLAIFTICILFGTSVLRNDEIPKTLKRRGCTCSRFSSRSQPSFIS